MELHTITEFASATFQYATRMRVYLFVIFTRVNTKRQGLLMLDATTKRAAPRLHRHWRGHRGPTVWMSAVPALPR